MPALKNIKVIKEAAESVSSDINPRDAKGREGGGAGSDWSTYLYNGINYSSSGKLRPPRPLRPNYIQILISLKKSLFEST